MNSLYYGDNLEVLRESIKDESVDLIYLDPPFNSKRDYNLLFKSPHGHASDAQITAFEDSWHWGTQAESEFEEILHQPNTDVAEMMRALRGFLGENDMMAYLTMMANRLLELHRVLKPTGSLYLHCDPTASHYLKIVLDGVFGKENFRNEISWKRSQPKSHTVINFPNCRDILLRYSKSDVQGKKKGADTGIDGLIFFQDDRGGAKKVIVSVKGGEHVGVEAVRSLDSVIKREKAEIGLLVTLAEPTKAMTKEAASAGFYDSPIGQSYPKVQVLTIAGLLSFREAAKYPDLARGGLTFKKAKVEKVKGEQGALF